MSTIQGEAVGVRIIHETTSTVQGAHKEVGLLWNERLYVSL